MLSGREGYGATINRWSWSRSFPQQKEPNIPVKQKADSSEATDDPWAVRLGTKVPKSFASKRSPALK